jgi:hypothetical protein
MCIAIIFLIFPLAIVFLLTFFQEWLKEALSQFPSVLNVSQRKEGILDISSPCGSGGHNEQYQESFAFVMKILKVEMTLNVSI